MRQWTPVFWEPSEGIVKSARADMYRRLGSTAKARASYEETLVPAQQKLERQFLQESKYKEAAIGFGRVQPLL